jgi:hypothetical protein
MNIEVINTEEFRSYGSNFHKEFPLSNLWIVEATQLHWVFSVRLSPFVCVKVVPCFQLCSQLGHFIVWKMISSVPLATGDDMKAFFWASGSEQTVLSNDRCCTRFKIVRIYAIFLVSYHFDIHPNGFSHRCYLRWCFVTNTYQQRLMCMPFRWLVSQISEVSSNCRKSLIDWMLLIRSQGNRRTDTGMIKTWRRNSLWNWFWKDNECVLFAEGGFNRSWFLVTTNHRRLNTCLRKPFFRLHEHLQGRRSERAENVEETKNENFDFFQKRYSGW